MNLSVTVSFAVESQTVLVVVTAHSLKHRISKDTQLTYEHANEEFIYEQLIDCGEPPRARKMRFRNRT